MKPHSVSALLRMVRISPYKLNIVAKTIRKKSIHEAILVLKGMKKRAAVDVHKVLLSAVANAENNFGLDIDNLVVSEACVGKNITLRRTDIKGRSRLGRITKPFSQLRIVLTENS
jgi:large subunit ribosomal protein L22